MFPENGDKWIHDDGEYEKPPLGLMPRRIHNENRMREVYEAIQRYRKEGKMVPGDWIDEYFDLAALLN